MTDVLGTFPFKEDHTCRPVCLFPVGICATVSQVDCCSITAQRKCVANVTEQSPATAATNDRASSYSCRDNVSAGCCEPSCAPCPSKSRRKRPGFPSPRSTPLPRGSTLRFRLERACLCAGACRRRGGGGQVRSRGRCVRHVSAAPSGRRTAWVAVQWWLGRKICEICRLLLWMPAAMDAAQRVWEVFSWDSIAPKSLFSFSAAAFADQMT